VFGIGGGVDESEGSRSRALLFSPPMPPDIEPHASRYGGVWILSVAGDPQVSALTLSVSAITAFIVVEIE